MFQWDDLKFFLATVRAGSASQAGGVLGVSTSTVTRRLAVLEEQLGVALFSRTPDGLVPTDEGRAIAHAAESVERAASMVEAAADDAQGEPAGLVHLTCVPDLAQLVIIPALSELRALYPRLRLEITASVEQVDIGRRECDIALRSFRPAQGDLVARKLRTIAFGVFVAASLASREPSMASDLDRRGWSSLPWVTLSPKHVHAPEARWLEEALPGVEAVVTASSMTELRLMAAAGIGVAVLPRLFGVLTPGLREIPWIGEPALPSVPFYAVCHSSGYRTTRVRAAWEFLGRICADDGDEARVVEDLRRRHRAAYG